MIVFTSLQVKKNKKMKSHSSKLLSLSNIPRVSIRCNRYASSLSNLQTHSFPSFYNSSPFPPFSPSRFGFGSFRFSQDYETSLRFALSQGINVIDTASHYEQGRSEQSISRILQKDDQKDIFVMSKAGYVYPDIFPLPSSLWNKMQKVKMNEKLWHSIDPDFIEYEISQSLTRLPSLSGFLLNNPERLLMHWDKEQWTLYMMKAFKHLEKEVTRGKLLFFYLGLLLKESTHVK